MNEGQPPLDITAMLSRLGEVQDSLYAAQASAASTTVVGSAAGGAVEIEMTGAGQFVRVTIDPAVIDPDEADMLQDLVLAALRDAGDKAAAMHDAALGNLDLPGGLSDFLKP
ncbi:MAG: YbaB/EbfC family nucleoid-associated protein [Acidimicrobiales bacterium]